MKRLVPSFRVQTRPRRGVTGAHRITLSFVVCALALSAVSAQPAKRKVESGRRYQRIVIRNAIIIDGN
ncbi:MAG: hypothetical protein H0T45_04635, partial [Pyrinomonadaceae bacterium]|nr:hypothetical protein [Pyrinomonadaceae bacterium]